MPPDPHRLTLQYYEVLEARHDRLGGPKECQMSVAHHIRVYGTPRAQPRPRMTRAGHAYNPPSADEWKEEIEWEVKRLRIPMMEGHVCIDVIFYMTRPQRMKKETRLRTCKKKPDIDNLLKAVYDAMTEAGVWGDDAQIVYATGKKFYSNDIEEPGCRITVSEEDDSYAWSDE